MRNRRLVVWLVVTTTLVLVAGPLAAQTEPIPASPPFSDPVATPGGDLPGDPAIQLVKVTDGLTQPVNITNAGDGSGRLFVVERPGRIRVIQDGILLEQPFLDIVQRVGQSNYEQGLLGLAFDPDYERNGFFYINYTDHISNNDNLVARYSVSPSDPNLADPASEVILIRQDHPYTAHNGGEMQFGPEGDLYVSLGDGGYNDRPFEYNTPDLGNFLGKILRIDIRQSDETRGLPYSIPAGNPFLDRPGVRPETWAYGLRNPWQFSIDRQTGDLFIPDVGHNTWEEINYQPAGVGGAFYGWDVLESIYCFGYPAGGCRPVGVPPVALYRHGEEGCVVVGIGVYRGAVSPALNGIFFSGDYCTGRVRGLARDGNGDWQFQVLFDAMDLTMLGGGEDEAGELYVGTCSPCDFSRFVDPFAAPTGTLWRIVDANQIPEGAELAPPEPPMPVATPLAGGRSADEDLIPG